MAEIRHDDAAISVRRDASGAARHGPAQVGEVFGAAVHIALVGGEGEDAGGVAAAGGEHRVVARVGVRLAQRPEVGGRGPRYIVQRGGRVAVVHSERRDVEEGVYWCAAVAGVVDVCLSVVEAADQLFPVCGAWFGLDWLCAWPRSGICFGAEREVVEVGHRLMSMLRFCVRWGCKCAVRSCGR